MFGWNGGKVKSIITIDDAEEKTLELLLKENVGILIVVGVPVGLIGKNLESRKVASYDLILDVLKNLNVEMSSHGYYHILPKTSAYTNAKIFLSRFVSFPDKLDYTKRVKYFLSTKCPNNLEDFETDDHKEVVNSKETLNELFGREIITYLYPGGNLAGNILNLVSKNYLFARTSEVGVNYIDDLEDSSKRYCLKTISFSRYTNFSKTEKYYNKLLKKEDKINKEFLVIEAYHTIIKDNTKTSYLYDVSYKDFENHIKFVENVGEIVKFFDFR